MQLYSFISRLLNWHTDCSTIDVGDAVIPIVKTSRSKIAMCSTRVYQSHPSENFASIFLGADFGALQSAPEIALPFLEDLLTGGGDARIVRGANGVNKYGCYAIPKPELLSYGSCTASTISKAGFAASAGLYRWLKAAARLEDSAATYARELNRMRGELVALHGLTHLSGLDIIFGASGTDLHLFAAQLLCLDAPLLVIMAEAAETGSGVPAALNGRHFSDCTALGGVVTQGEWIGRKSNVEVAEVKCRAENGDLYSASVIDAEVEKLTASAIAKGQRVLLILTDLSKTGLAIPSPACALALKRRYADKLDILVDACQFRLSKVTIRAYLEQDFLLAMTGSKFVTGPAFSGALFVPRSMAQRLRGRKLPLMLSLYSPRADWPDTWAARSTLPDVANYGLLLRFEAALAELRAFHTLSETDIRAFLETFAAAIQKRLNDDPVFVPLATQEINRQPLAGQMSWDHIPTIFPFLMRRESGILLNKDEMKKIYELTTAARCQLGQPVASGALRLCVDMRLIVDALSPGGRGGEAVINGAMRVLDKAALSIPSPSGRGLG